MTDSLFSLREIREAAQAYADVTERTGPYAVVTPAAVLALIDVAETATCRRFTTCACRQRPEINPKDYCVTCKALSRFAEYVDA